MAQNVMMQLLLEVRQFRQAWDRAATSSQKGAQRIARSAQRGGRAMDKATKKATRFAKAMEFLGKRVIGAGLFFAAFYQGLITFRQLIGDAVAELFNLDDALRRVQSITKESDRSIELLRGQLLSLAKQGKLFDQSAAAVADSMFTIAQAGFDSAESLTLARLAAEGAAVGFTTAEISAQVLVGVLKAYDLPVSKARDVMDVLFQTVDTGIVTFGDLATGLGKVLASANSLNIPLTEVNAAIATMTLRGFTADQAMTSLGRIMQTFIRPSQRAKKAASDVGIELNAATIANDGLIGTMQKMFLASDGNVTKFAELFDRIQSTRGAISLFSDEGALLNAVMVEMGLATGGVGAMALALEERSKSLKFQLSVLRSQILAVTTGALEPMMDGLGAIVRQFNKVLAGKVPIINYFADLGSAVRALIILFIWMKRVAISSLMTSIAASVQAMALIMVGATPGVSRLTTAMVGLSGVMKLMTPLVILLALFALLKFGKRLSFAAQTADMAKRALDGLMERLRQIDEQGFAAGLGESQIALLKTDELTRTLTSSVDDYTRALFVSIGGTERGVKSLIDLGVWANETGVFIDSMSFGLLNMGKTLNEVSDDFAQFVLDAITRSGEGVEGIEGIVSELGNLALAADDPAMVTMLRAGRDAAAELIPFVLPLSGALAAARREATLFDEAMIDGKTTAKDIKEGIARWVKPLTEARAAMEAILGLTSTQSVLLKAIIGPLELNIAERNVEIADTKADIIVRETKLRDLGIDVDETEDSILSTLNDQLDTLELLNEADAAGIGQAKVRLELEEKTEEEAVRLRLHTVALGKAIDEEIILALDEILIMSKDDIPNAMGFWLTAFENAGGVLDEEVLDKILDIIEDVKGIEMSIDVSTVLTRLGFVGDTVARLKRQLGLGQLSPEAFRFGAGIVAGEGRGFAHGVKNFMGGMALVGEAGPELLRLPRGSDVIPNSMVGPTMRQQGREGGGSMTVNAEVNVTTSMMKDFQELKRQVLQDVSEQLDNAAARANLSKPRFGVWGVGLPRT